jgi:hypothetical protein
MIKEFKEMLFKRRLMKNNIEILNVDYRVLRRYKDSVRGNKDTSTEQCILKLTRNWYLATVLQSTKSVEIRQYGNLQITYSKEEQKIVDLWNLRGLKQQQEIDLVERERLTKLLGIIKDDKKEGVA